MVCTQAHYKVSTCPFKQEAGFLTVHHSYISLAVSAVAAFVLWIYVKTNNTSLTLKSLCADEWHALPQYSCLPCYRHTVVSRQQRFLCRAKMIGLN
jgi:hypothetical protein